ncbi:MAG: hypothetical protein M3065_07185 [Actinomycetota bacterium]|nr:hypothetical protein [Actinomycetota bacterium]
MRKLTAGTVLCLLIAGCGGGSSKRATNVTSTSATAATTASTATTVTHLPSTFNAGYEQAWGEMKHVGAEVGAAISQVKRAKAHHQTVSNSTLASEFATFASQFEPAVIELQGVAPPASVAGAYKSMATAAVGMAGSLRNFASDASANRIAQGQRDLASYFAYAVTIDKAAMKIFDKLGLK